MIILKFNGLNIDTDEKTAIGVDFQAYDVKNPAQRKVNISNSFTIPKTSNNAKILGIEGDVYNISTALYSTVIVDCWVKNTHLIRNAKARIEAIDDYSISIFIFEKNDFWEKLKLFKWSDFELEFFNWMYVNDYIWTASVPFTSVSFWYVLSEISNKSEYITLLLYYTNAINQLNNESILPDTTFLEVGNDSNDLIYHNQICLGFNSQYFYKPQTTETGHFSVFCKSIFKFIEYKYGVNLLTDKTNLVGNIWNDPIANKICIPFRNIHLGSGYTYDIESSLGTIDPNYPQSFTIGSDGLLYQFVIDAVLSDLTYKVIVGLGSSTTTNEYLDNIVIDYANQHQTINIPPTFALTAGSLVYVNIKYYLCVYTDPIDCNLLSLKNITSNNYQFSLNQNSVFNPLKDVKDKNEKTLFDFVNSFFQYFNIIKDEFYLNGNEVIRLARFDDIKTSVNFKDWSGKIGIGKTLFPSIQNIAQENYIKFKDVYPEGAKTLNQKIITCQNKNIDATADLFSIDAYIPSLIDIGNNDLILNLSTKECFKTFEFIIENGYTTESIVTLLQEYTFCQIFTTFQFKKAAIYDLNSEYIQYNNIMQYPKLYEIKKWLTLQDVENLQFFMKYWIRELGASFFLNKISGFNPLKSNEPTTLELLLLDYTSPPLGQPVEAFVDGFGNSFVDGAGDYFISN